MRSTERVEAALLISWIANLMLLECKHCEAVVNAEEIGNFSDMPDDGQGLLS
jgi:hypothetical protein